MIHDVFVLVYETLTKLCIKLIDHIFTQATGIFEFLCGDVKGGGGGGVTWLAFLLTVVEQMRI